MMSNCIHIGDLTFEYDHSGITDIEHFISRSGHPLNPLTYRFRRASVQVPQGSPRLRAAAALRLCATGATTELSGLIMPYMYHEFSGTQSPGEGYRGIALQALPF